MPARRSLSLLCARCTATRLSLHCIPASKPLDASSHLASPRSNSLLTRLLSSPLLSPTPPLPLPWLLLVLVLVRPVRTPSLPHRYRMRDARSHRFPKPASYMIPSLICLVRRLRNANAPCHPAAGLRVQYAKLSLPLLVAALVLCKSIFHTSSMRTHAAQHFPMLQPARNFSGICSETPRRCVRSASIDTVFPPCPWRSPLYRSAKLSPPNHLFVSFAFSWLVRSYVGLSLLVRILYAVCYRN